MSPSLLDVSLSEQYYLKTAFNFLPAKWKLNMRISRTGSQGSDPSPSIYFSPFAYASVKTIFFYCIKQWSPTFLVSGTSFLENKFSTDQGRSEEGKLPDDSGTLHFLYTLFYYWGGNGNPLQCFCLENPVDRGAWWLQSMGSQKLGHDWATNTYSIIITLWYIMK